MKRSKLPTTSCTSWRRRRRSQTDSASGCSWALSASAETWNRERTARNNVTIGRSKDSLLHLNNSSVSRNHCLLYLDEEKNIKIFDNKSKFGTLLRDKSLGSKLNYIKMNNENSNITLQKGNTVYNFSYTII